MCLTTSPTPKWDMKFRLKMVTLQLQHQSHWHCNENDFVITRTCFLTSDLKSFLQHCNQTFMLTFACTRPLCGTASFHLILIEMRFCLNVQTLVVGLKDQEIRIDSYDISNLPCHKSCIDWIICFLTITTLFRN